MPQPADGLPPQVLPVDLAHATRLLNHGPTVLVSSAHQGRRNIMAAAWSTPVEFSPPRVVVVIDKQTATRALVEASGRLALNLPGAALVDVCYTMGSVSAHDEAAGDADKFARFGLHTWNGPATGLPLLAGCAAWLEGRLIPEPHAQQAYDCCFMAVEAAWADARVFRDGRWCFDDDNADLHTLHHLGGGVFVRPAVRTLRARRLDAVA